jgi:hypothetical protein
MCKQSLFTPLSAFSISIVYFIYYHELDLIYQNVGILV